MVERVMRAAPSLLVAALLLMAQPLLGFGPQIAHAGAPSPVSNPSAATPDGEVEQEDEEEGGFDDETPAPNKTKAKPADADEGGFGDDDGDGGFGDGDGGDGFGGFDGDDGAVDAPSPWSLTGFYRSSWALWLERFNSNPFAKGRQSLDLRLSYVNAWFKLLVAGHAEYDFAYLVERDSYDQATLDTFEWQVDTREAFVEFNFGAVQLIVGRQIVAWGEGDAFSPLDVVNPRDNREPGLSDLDDLRLPSLATRLAISSGPFRLELMVVHESWFGYSQPARGPFSPFDQLLADDPTVAALLGDRDIVFDHIPERFSGRNQQYFMRAVYKGTGVDLGFHIASVLDRQGVLVPPDVSSLITANPITLAYDHPRVLVMGWSGALPWKDFVFKWELATELDKPVNVGLPPANFGVATTDLFHTMVGVSWTGVTDLNVGFELWKPIMLSDPSEGTGQELLAPLDAPLMALRASYTMLNETLSFSAAVTMVGWTGEVGVLARGEVSYKPIDALSLSLGFVTYHPGDEFGPFYGLDRHDRLFLRARWDFTIL